MRHYNFSAGPAALPEPVLKRAQEELLDWQGRGLSVMEISHRSDAFIAVAAEAEADLRELLAIPDDYRVLFLQGGATAQFAMVPLNLLPEGGSADYVDSGHWSQKAIKEARRYGRVSVAASSEACGYTALPSDWRPDPDAAYLHYTPNETIHGVEFHAVPEQALPEVPLVADMSSTLLSRPLDVGRFGLIYAGAQKNIGPAGLTVVIVRDALLGRARAITPTMDDYRRHADAGSMLNTPPTFAWYLAGLVFQWLKQQGGLTAMAAQNRTKAERLYTYIDDSDYYRCPVAPDCRSWMNVPFTLPDEALNKPFLDAAESAGLLNLKGHRSVGGMRASLYNAVPPAAVAALIDFLRYFADRHG